MEFVLKHHQFEKLRENPFFEDTICPSDLESQSLIQEMMKQIRALHPMSTTIHIGSDEAYHIAEDMRCGIALREKFDNSTDDLKLSHISKVARFAREQLNFSRVLAWNDMFDKISSEKLNKHKLGDWLTPVVWGYIVDVTVPGYFPDGMFDRYEKVFSRWMYAGAFKGANGIDQIFMNATRYFLNVESYVRLHSQISEVSDYGTINH
ncbi:hypothetical protein AB6A40_010497 [Gnathostoma spinigerum]|uniref:beta-N-acetylhexosaminidase n=1 Tax=Gnathostoma spinigerum TaxID=75299 RepID=A0ABD6F1V0_9BILA